MISSQPRYDHFDTSPCKKYSVFGENNMISSQPRYDHFDTSPYMFTLENEGNNRYSIFQKTR